MIVHTCACLYTHVIAFLTVMNSFIHVFKTKFRWEDIKQKTHDSIFNKKPPLRLFVSTVTEDTLKFNFMDFTLQIYRFTVYNCMILKLINENINTK